MHIVVWSIDVAKVNMHFIKESYLGEIWMDFYQYLVALSIWYCE